MPERSPRHKPGVTHYAHRVAMIRRATKPHAQLAVLESEDRIFSTAHTLPRLQKQFPGATLVYVCGSDVLMHMASWPHISQLLETVELCVGIRSNETRASVEQAIARLPIAPRATVIIDSYFADASSSKIRQAIRERTPAHGILQSVIAYAKQAWLYL